MYTPITHTKKCSLVRSYGNTCNCGAYEEEHGYSEQPTYVPGWADLAIYGKESLQGWASRFESLAKNNYVLEARVAALQAQVEDLQLELETEKNYGQAQRSTADILGEEFRNLREALKKMETP